MRSLAIFLIGMGSMVAAWFTFGLVFTDASPLGSIIGDATPLLVPAVVVGAGVLAAIVDRRPRALVTVLGGACATVAVFAAGVRLWQGPEAEWVQLAVIGIGLAVLMLTAGFVPAALVGWLAHRIGQGT
jgi:hypothetical protein